MSDGYLSFEHGQVTLGGQLIPGELLSMEIGDEVRFDTAKVDNLSGTKKIPLGWEDAFIVLNIELLTDERSTCYEKLSKLNGIFRGLDNQANPKVYDIVNAHALARGINQVVFKGLKSSENNEDDVIKADLGFDEHNPPVIPVEIRSSAADTNSSSAPDINQGDKTVADETLMADKVSPFDAGFNEGLS